MWQKYLFISNGMLCSLLCAYFLLKNIATKDDKMLLKIQKVAKKIFPFENAKRWFYGRCRPGWWIHSNIGASENDSCMHAQYMDGRRWWIQKGKTLQKKLNLIHAQAQSMVGDKIPGMGGGAAEAPADGEAPAEVGLCQHHQHQPSPSPLPPPPLLSSPTSPPSIWSWQQIVMITSIHLFPKRKSQEVSPRR